MTGVVSPLPWKGVAQSAGGCMQYNIKLKKRAQELRTNATKQEQKLWYEFLREHRPRFTRQRIVGNYILDFYCAKAKLAIELDGSQHYEQENVEYDITRDKFINELGITVMRFPNNEVDKNFTGVCEKIMEKVGQPPPSADGTPFQGRGHENE